MPIQVTSPKKVIVKGLLAIVTVFTLLGAAAPAAAQVPGIRAGVSGDPDQFYFGAHFEAGPVVERLWFRPNVEIGVGDDVTLVAVNVEFVYRVPLDNSAWRLLLGGGPALIVADHDDESDTGGGFNILVGAEHRNGFFTELKVGLIDSPSVKFGVGYTFR
jgi:hypothetical protein